MQFYISNIHILAQMDGNTSSSRSIGIDALFQSAGSGVQLFSGTVFYLIAVRLFNTTNVGALSLFVAIVGLFNIVFSFGLSTAAQHFTSYNLGKGDYASVKRTIHRILLLSTSLSLAGLVTLEVLAGEISSIFLHSMAYTEMVRLLGIVLFGSIMFGILNGVMLGVQMFRLSAILSIVIWGIYYFGALIFAVFLRSIETIVFGWIMGIFLGVIVELFILLFSVRKYLGNGDPPSNALIIRYSAPILLSGIISYGAMYADRFIVSGLLSLSYLGIYNFSLLIASAITFMVSPFSNILMPKFSEYFGRGEKETIASMVSVSSTLLSYIYVPSAMGIAALAPMILNLLAGSDYVSGAIPLIIIMFFSALFVTQFIIIQAISSIRKTKLFLYSSALALSGNTVLSILLIPHFELVGAALGFSSVGVLSFLVLYYFARKEGIISVDLGALTKIWLSAIIMFLSVFSLSNFMGQNMILLPLFIITGAAIYFVMSRVLRVFRVENKELILSLFPDRYIQFKRLLKLLVLH